MPAHWLSRLALTLVCFLALTGSSCWDSTQGAVPTELNVGFAIYDFTCIDPEGISERLTTAVWYPTAEEPGPHTYNNDVASSVAVDAVPGKEYAPYPLIVFNHGAYGSGIGFLAFTERLASEGFIVAAPDYVDTVSPDLRDQVAFSRIRGSEGVADVRSVFEAVGAFADMLNTDRDASLYYLERFRLRKASFVIDRMLEMNRDGDSPFYGLIDEDAVGMAGHSLGGLTTLGLIGGHADRSMHDDRVKAAILLSSPVHPFEDNIPQIDIPVMIMHGDQDAAAIHPEVQRGVAYANAGPPKFYLVIKRCTHFTFGNAPCQDWDSIPKCGKANFSVRVICDYASAFFKRYLRQDLEAEELLRASDETLETYECELQ